MAGTDFSSVGRVVMLFAPDEYGAGASATPIVLDTKGWRWAHISFAFGAVTSPQVKVANIEESDDGPSKRPQGVSLSILRKFHHLAFFPRH